jgi:hypothetical protein
MNRALTAAIAAMGLFAAASASAETLEATWTYSPSGTPVTIATWEQDSAPTPVSFGLGEGTEIPISDFVAYAPIQTVTSITYYNNGFTPVIFSTIPLGGIFVVGPQAYTGSEDAPQFAPGSFSGNLDGDDTLLSTLTLSAVPEPSTWALLIAGFAGLGAASVGWRRVLAA